MKLGNVLRIKLVKCLGCGASHFAKRSDARCDLCRNAISRLKAKKRRAEHPEKSKDQLAEWRLRNQDKVKAHKRKFQEERRAHRAFYQKTREALKLRAMPSWTDVGAIKGMYELCGVFRRIGLNMQVDHIVPLKGKLVSGLHVADNLQLLHAVDNMKKKNRFFEEVPI